MRLGPLLLLAVALPARSQVRAAPAYDGTSPGHPADEPGPELGATPEDAFALLSRGDRDAARLSAARCLRGDAAEDRCRLVVEAVEEGVEAPKLGGVRADLDRAEVHFRAGADWYFHGERAEARREWDACRRLDPGNPFCALGLKLLRRGKPPRHSSEAAVAPAAGPAPATDRSAEQAYLAGMIWYQKGELERAAADWKRCAAAAPGKTGFDCRAGLERIRKLRGVE